MTKFYSLNENSSDISFDEFPEFVTSNIGKEGYYTLLSVEEKENEDESDFVGLAQFYLGMNIKGMILAELVYVYVVKEYRGRNEGYKLIQMMTDILKEQDVDAIVTNAPDDGGETEQFFRECGFITARDKEGKRQRQYKLTRRE